ncbi:MAG: plasmid mobilization relaxosome protein MobC [Clostridiaceae bacterium]
MMPEEEKQDTQLHFRVTRREKEIIDQKMAQMGTKRLGVYLRKMAIDGYVVKLDLPEVRELVSLLRYAGNNLNQLTKVAHTTGNIYGEEIGRLEEKFEEVLSKTNEMLIVLRKVDV